MILDLGMMMNCRRGHAYRHSINSVPCKGYIYIT